MLVKSAAIEVEQTQGTPSGGGPAAAKAPERTVMRTSSALIQAGIDMAELQDALPIRPATRVVVPFLLYAPQARSLPFVTCSLAPFCRRS